MQGANCTSTASCPESPTNSSGSEASNSDSSSTSNTSSNSQCRQLLRSRPLEERRGVNVATDSTKSLMLLPQVKQLRLTVVTFFSLIMGLLHGDRSMKDRRPGCVRAPNGSSRPITRQTPRSTRLTVITTASPLPGHLSYGENDRRRSFYLTTYQISYVDLFCTLAFRYNQRYKYEYVSPIFIQISIPPNRQALRSALSLLYSPS